MLQNKRNLLLSSMKKIKLLYSFILKNKGKKIYIRQFLKEVIQTFSMGITKNDPPPAVSVAIAINFGFTAQKELS